tara:strand:+ start:169 stop:468 length:300 start_codon:yes stop_codon:yes gene_type:complete
MRINNFIPIRYQQSSFIRYTIEAGILVLGFKLLAGALASCAFIGVAVGVGLIFASLVYSIARNPSQRDELLRYSFIGFSLVEASGLIGLVMGFVLLFGF